MFYTAEFLRKRVNRKGQRLPVCWLAATITNFVDNEVCKLSKKEILNVDVSAACEDIMHGITGSEGTPRFSLYLASQLTFGALRVLEYQYAALEDECEKLFVNTLVPSQTKQKTGKKSNKKSKDNNLDLVDAPELEEIDLITLFSEDQTDRNLIQEDNFNFQQFDTPLKFGDEQYYLTGFSSPHRPIHLQASSEVPNFDNLEEATESDIPFESLPMRGMPETPKRKHRRAHDDTPTKRGRVSSTALSTKLSETARSPVPAPAARRSIFPALMQSSTGDGDAVLPEPTATNLVAEVVPALIRIELSPPTESTEGIPPRPIMTTADDMDQQPQQSKDRLTVPGPLQIVQSYRPAPTPVGQDEQGLEPPSTVYDRVENQEPVAVITEFPEDQVQDNVQIDSALQRVIQEDFVLPELEVSLNSQDRRRRRKVVFDEKKQINLIDPFSQVNQFTRPTKYASVNLYQKIPAAELMTLPATSLKIETNMYKRSCSWGFTLRNRFLEKIETSNYGVDKGFRTTLNLHRDDHVNKSPRFSGLRLNVSKPKTSQKTPTSAPSKKSALLDSNVETEDRQLMPLPPVPLPEQHGDQQEQEEYADPQEQRLPQQSRVTSEQVESELAASSHQDRPSTAVAHQPESHREALVPESDENFLAPVHVSRLEPNDPEPPMSALTESESLDESLIMSMSEFYEFLEKVWKNSADSKFELDDILPPEKASAEEFINYFTYCCEFEKQGKLVIEQERAYGPVYIIKVLEEEEVM